MRRKARKTDPEQANSSFPQQSPQLWKGGVRPVPMRFFACGFPRVQIL
jgi:hypothetical protein